MSQVPFVSAIIGGSVADRMGIVQDFASRVDEQVEGEKVAVFVIDSPPNMVSENPWVQNDVAQRVVMFQERQRYMELLYKMNEGEYDHVFIFSIDCAYSLLAGAMMENNQRSTGTEASLLVGADGNPLNEDAYIINQLAGSIVYSRGLIPYVYGPHGEFFNGGVWLVDTGEDEATVIEKPIQTGDPRSPQMLQKIPCGTPTQVLGYMAGAVLNGMEVLHETLPVGAESAGGRLFDSLFVREDSDGGSEEE